MSIEDIFSGVGVAILIGISAISRYRQGRANRGATPSEHPLKVENNEVIEVDYFEANRQELTKNTKSQKVKAQKEPTKNATNRTSTNTAQIEKTSDENSKPSRKFNMRDAVIYSEILNPKFKQEE